MSWEGRLRLHYRRDGERTVAHDAHTGPLRVLQRLYPEGGAVCHHVLVHPPGGIAGGDRLHVEVQVDEHAHALVTTPGATRFYRSAGEPALQHARLQLAPQARLEWLPLENIAHPGCLAHNELQFDLAAGAALMGWDVLALGLPAADAPFDSGCFHQAVHWPGRWLESGRLDATDRVLLDGPPGLDGLRVLGTLWFAEPALAAPQREALLEAARVCVAGSAALPLRAGATAPHEDLVTLRVLAARVEPLMQLLRCVRAAWRRIAWNLEPAEPRVWQT